MDSSHNSRRKQLLQLAALSSLATSLAASGGGGGESSFRNGPIELNSPQLGLPPGVLLDQLQILGIKDATAEHKLTPESVAELPDIFTAQPERPDPLFESPPLTDSGLIVVQEITDEVLAALRREPVAMYQLDPRKFEELVARLLEDQGCEVTLTKRTRDGGFDILGRTKSGPASLTFVAECKRYAPDNRVGVEIIRGVYGVTELHRANFGLVVTSSSFSRDAKQETLRIGPRMQLADYRDICQWLQVEHP